MVIAAIVLFWSLPLRSLSASAAQESSIHGIVKDVQGSPIGGVKIYVTSGPNSGANATSSRDGTYQFIGFEAGAYELYFTKAGYDSRFARFELCPAENAVVDPILFSRLAPLNEHAIGKVTNLSIAAGGDYSINAGDPTRSTLVLCL